MGVLLRGGVCRGAGHDRSWKGYNCWVLLRGDGDRVGWAGAGDSGHGTEGQGGWAVVKARATPGNSASPI